MTNQSKQQRVTQERVMFHVAPSSITEEIRKEGLRGDPDGWDEIVWLWDDLDTAKAFATDNETVWQVKTSSLSIEPGNNPHSKHGGYAWAATGPIAPALILIVN